jgi:hypothetical protein
MRISSKPSSSRSCPGPCTKAPISYVHLVNVSGLCAQHIALLHILLDHLNPPSVPHVHRVVPTSGHNLPTGPSLPWRSQFPAWLEGRRCGAARRSRFARRRSGVGHGPECVCAYTEERAVAGQIARFHERRESRRVRSWYVHPITLRGAPVC